ncbi:raffinose/stachyose/melibiose transport system substrate-binding protein [Microbacteriaceae bacterium SG_E_30_P1]|uniref:Probable sugar-binding periplasmic protein n=1 Tax=Antiquaquibacter oligotrophicus TaxID=2880260 RepID=A0ABT6KQ94_9MICO|nr:extracellular solute-binding protein [Antiquaquibacter oligotrophicus]MDH6182148.1 raffinose/stachyose/melibiose transport system substrate-binding protein [Antiquaquibacter oligotrophicus]UDF12189.1 extracellular solute-binding protein [Antiquaquibacter oligotrophicus]
MRSRLAPIAAIAVTAMGLALAGCAGGGADSGDTTKLVLGSWRTEDIAMWEDEILPAFHEANPDIEVEFAATDTNDYNAAIQSQVAGGNAPDLITCRPFDVNRAWIEDGYFDDLTGLEALDSFTPTALAAWTGADDAPYCVPVASVLAGFYYNKAIFDELGLEVPTTQAEFVDVLQAVKDNGKYTPLALGSADGWQLAYNVLYSMGPNYWKGEEGRLGLIDGTQKLTDPDFVAAFQAVDDLKPYLPSGFEAITYDDMGQLFNLGQAAIIPDGSWNINQLTSTGLDVGVFGAPVPEAGDQRYQQEMPDMAIGLSADSKNKEAAKVFLNWLTSDDFLSIFVNKLPGFFAMTTDAPSYDNPLAQEFSDLKTDAELTPRLALDRLSAGTPPLDDEIWVALQEMYAGTLTPDTATAQLQADLESWYVPAG